MTPITAGVLGLITGLALAALVWWLSTRPPRSVPSAQTREQAPDQGSAVMPAPALPRGLPEVLGALRSGGIVIDPRGRVRLASHSASAYGLVRGPDLVHTDLRDLVLQVQHDGVIREEDYDIIRGPLSYGQIVIGVRVAPVSDGFTIVLVEDRTQARRVEEVRRDFVVNVSHELKTPVGGLTLLAEAVEGARDDPEAVARFAGRIKIETERLARLVNEIVDLSRLQTKDLLADMVIVDVAACAEEAVDHSKVIAGDRDVRAVTVGPRDLLRVYGDHELITTAIRNLVTNAISYSDDGTRVTVVTRLQGERVEVAVTDEGHGISPSDQERVFERFYRVDAARSRSTGGTGLGLSIVKHICSNHRGDITLWSEEGQGSTFTIRLPAADDERPLGALAPHRPGQRARVADPAHGDTVPAGATAPQLHYRHERED